MPKLKLATIGVAALAAASVIVSAPTKAQDYPHDTVTLITHSSAGGGTTVRMEKGVSRGDRD